jgi:hypothetical protein
MISSPLFAQAEGKQYLNELFWVIHARDRPGSHCSHKLACTRDMLASAKRGVALTQEEFPLAAVDCDSTHLLPVLCSSSI